jgi:L-iditol 2-dehydrogenase
MKAAVYYSNSDLRIEDAPMPQIGPGELLVKIMASGICGTDVMEWYRIRKAGHILGHEIAGYVAEAGKGVTDYKQDDRVFVSHHVPCNECKYCAAGNHTACSTLHAGNYDPGGFCEFVRIPEINVKNGTYKLPESMRYEEGAMIEPLACVVRGQRVAHIRKGHTVLILGCGISGLMNIQFAKYKGARVIATDINLFRLEKAKSFGADQVIHASKSLDGIKADRIIVCTGAQPAVDQAFQCMDRSGIILFFAIPKENFHVPVVDFWRNEWTLTTSYGAAPRDLEEALDLISNRTVNMMDLITHRLPLDRIQEGFETAAAATGDSLKVVIFPHEMP